MGGDPFDWVEEQWDKAVDWTEDQVYGPVRDAIIPKIPEPPKPPPPPPPPEMPNAEPGTAQTAAEREARERQRRQARAATGRQSTIFTGSLGLPAPAPVRSMTMFTSGNLSGTKS